MRRLRPLLPLGVLLVLAAIAAEPLAHAQLTCSDDGAFHLFRAVQLGALIELGHLFPRWAPHMAQGYGFPFYNFYAPLSSYLVVGLHQLGLDYPAALRLAFGLALWGAGSAAFLFTRQRWGERAGLAAGAAYLFAPYLAYDALFRGNLAETLAFVWPPLVLWGIQRAVDSRRRLAAGHWLLIAGPYAALILTHNIFALLASPLFAGYAALAAGRARSGKALAVSALALLLGITLTTYFWLPALAERGLVHAERLLVRPIFTWDTNFIALGELLAPPRPADPALINPSPPRALGLVPAALALTGPLGLGLAALARRRRARPAGPPPTAAVPAGPDAWELAFFALALLAYGFMTLPASAPVWRLLPPLELVQFPWRMLGPAALGAAVLIGAGVRVLEGQLPARLALLPASLAVLLVVAGNLSWWYPRYCATPAGDLPAMLDYERASGTIGTTAKGEYLPRAAEGVPADGALARALAAGQEPARLSGAAELTPGDIRDPLDAQYTAAAAAPTALVYQQFWYPGWQVLIDGTPVPTQPAAATGLVAFTLPAGSHTVRVRFGSTPLRDAASAASLLSAALLAAGLAAGWRRSADGRPRPALSGGGLWDLGLLALALLALKLAVVDRFPNPLRRPGFDGARVLQAQTPLAAELAGGLSVLGYDLAARTLAGDAGVDVALYVAPRAPLGRSLKPAFFLTDAAGRLWDDTDALLPPRWHREPPLTLEWPAGQYAQWAYRLEVLPGTPPGDYALAAAVFDRVTFETLSVLDEQGNAIAPQLALGSLTVARPAQPFRLQPETAAPLRFGPLRFLGYRVDQPAVRAGDTLALTWYWRAEAAPGTDRLARLELRDAAGRAAAGWDLEPANGYGTAQWRPGDEWRGQHRLIIPAGLAGGEYTLMVTVPGEAGAQGLGTLTVEAPERTFTPPPFQAVSGARFDGVGALAGYTVDRAGETLTVALVWEAAATPALSAKVFVHLDAGGRVWAQSDAYPAGGARPTTGWLPGEYVRDVHTLTLPADLPAGEYTLWAGLYDPLTNVRVRAAGPGAGADDRVQLATLTLP
ncbi:MAG: hypothetical protein JNK29_15000 [Anaerolineales bacterium]|nr:hypothetical protein [Anaerolineales bacterium]